MAGSQHPTFGSVTIQLDGRWTGNPGAVGFFQPLLLPVVCGLGLGVCLSSFYHYPRRLTSISPLPLATPDIPAPISHHLNGVRTSPSNTCRTGSPQSYFVNSSNETTPLTSELAKQKNIKSIFRNWRHFYTQTMNIRNRNQEKNCIWYSKKKNKVPRNKPNQESKRPVLRNLHNTEERN